MEATNKPVTPASRGSRLPRVTRVLSGTAVMLLAWAPVGFGVQFHDITGDGEEGFFGAVADNQLLGVESFASSTLGENETEALDGPLLAPGLANGPFPNGTEAALGMTLQVNTLGGAPATMSLGGVLFASGPGVDGAGFLRVGPENAAHSLDILLEPPGFLGEVTALRFSVFSTAATGEIRVYNTDNDLLAFQSIIGLGDEPRELGLVAAPGEVMFRVNFWSEGWGDAGDFQMYVVPEPSTWLLLLIGVGGFALFRRRAG